MNVQASRATMEPPNPLSGSFCLRSVLGPDQKTEIALIVENGEDIWLCYSDVAAFLNLRYSSIALKSLVTGSYVQSWQRIRERLQKLRYLEPQAAYTQRLEQVRGSAGDIIRTLDGAEQDAVVPSTSSSVSLDAPMLGLTRFEENDAAMDKRSTTFVHFLGLVNLIKMVFNTDVHRFCVWIVHNIVPSLFPHVGFSRCSNIYLQARLLRAIDKRHSERLANLCATLSEKHKSLQQRHVDLLRKNRDLCRRLEELTALGRRSKRVVGGGGGA